MSSSEKQPESLLVEDEFDTPEDRALLRKVDLRLVVTGMTRHRTNIVLISQSSAYSDFVVPAIFPRSVSFRIESAPIHPIAQVRHKEQTLEMQSELFRSYFMCELCNNNGIRLDGLATVSDPQWHKHIGLGPRPNQTSHRICMCHLRLTILPLLCTS